VLCSFLFSNLPIKLLYLPFLGSHVFSEYFLPWSIHQHHREYCQNTGSQTQHYIHNDRNGTEKFVLFLNLHNFCRKYCENTDQTQFTNRYGLLLFCLWKGMWRNVHAAGLSNLASWKLSFIPLYMKSAKCVAIEVLFFSENFLFCLFLEFLLK
jgi:hypothetical protein